ncbi:MAG: arabinose isomerase [Candidatus Cryptobacteroides sp.]
MNDKTHIGFISTGLNTYWNQFDGLLDNLTGYSKTIVSHIRQAGGVDVVDAGMVDSPEKAREAGLLLRESCVDVLFVYISTYCLSSTILPVAQEAGCPCIFLNIQPDSKIDYAAINSLGDRGRMTGMWLENCQACSIPELCCVFNRSGLKYDIVTGHLKSGRTWKEIDEWVLAAKAFHGMRHNRLGILGHYYCGMLDVYTDIQKQSATFGTHFELIEMDELATLRREVTGEETRAKIDEFGTTFKVSPDCDSSELERAARTSVALDKLVEKHGLGSMAYYYEGAPGSEHEDISTSVIAGNTILTGKGIPVAGECEVKNVQAMKIMSLLGAGGSFSEFYAMDFDDDVVLLGHDGPAHYMMSEDKVELVPLPVYHGKPGKGLSIQMTVRSMDVTLLSVCEGRDGVFLLVAEGQSVPGPVLNIGNTNSRYRFPCGMRTFFEGWVKAGPSHHLAVGAGHVAAAVRKLSLLFGIPTVTIG